MRWNYTKTVAILAVGQAIVRAPLIAHSPKVAPGFLNGALAVIASAILLAIVLCPIAAFFDWRSWRREQIGLGRRRSLKQIAQWLIGRRRRDLAGPALGHEIGDARGPLLGTGRQHLEAPQFPDGIGRRDQVD